ncbi:MAG: DnaA ATPase domain-containing protein, partial [Burkholderiales bacterium]
MAEQHDARRLRPGDLETQLGPDGSARAGDEHGLPGQVSCRLGGAGNGRPPQQVADLDAPPFNPLFFYGPVGLGKTHLMHAIGHRALQIDPNLTIRYVTSETFTNDVINDIRSSRMDDF